MTWVTRAHRPVTDCNALPDPTYTEKLTLQEPSPASREPTKGVHMTSNALDPKEFQAAGAIVHHPWHGWEHVETIVAP